MQLIANENVPLLTVVALRDVGHDVIWARTDMPGHCDEEILSRAQREERIILTHDKDFGDLAFQVGLPASCGIVLVRMGNLSPEIIAQRTVQVLGSRSDWAGHLAVIESHRVRMRSLPESS